MLDLDTPATPRLLADLVERGLLAKTSDAQPGPSGTFGPARATTGIPDPSRFL